LRNLKALCGQGLMPANAMENRLYFTPANASYFTQADVLVKSLSATQRLTTKLVIFGNGWNHEQVSKPLHKDRFF